MRYLSWIITVPVALAIISFAVSNREDVTLGLWPLPFETVVPVFVVGLAALVLGFVAGGVVAWFSSRHHRVTARQQTRRAARLEQDLAAERRARAEAERRQVEAERKLADAQRQISEAAAALPAVQPAGGQPQLTTARP